MDDIDNFMEDEEGGAPTPPDEPGDNSNRDLPNSSAMALPHKSSHAVTGWF